MPEDTATAPMPPSSEAILFSSTSTVGLATREYSKPLSSPDARASPRTAFSRSNAAEA